MKLVNTEYLPADRDAEQIGDLYRKAKASIVDSVIYQTQCGEKLSAKKDSLGHGKWLLWVKSQADVLQFGERTARMLMKATVNAGKRQLTSDLTVADATAISRATWGNTHVANNSGENEWYTPEIYLDAARSTMGGIDLDPASSAVANETVKAVEYFTIETDGLAHPWHGNVWLNPPYAQPLMGQFVEKLFAEKDSLDAFVTLTNNATETAWGQLLLQMSNAVCFPRGRIKFVDKTGEPSGAPLQGQMFCYRGSDRALFLSNFREFGGIAYV